MSDASGRLLAAAVGYAVARLRSVAGEDTLRELVGGVLPGEPALTVLRAHLTAAAGHAAAAEALAAPDPPDLLGAGRTLWRAVAELRAAAALLGVADPGPAVTDLVDGASPGGLVAALGLPRPTARLESDALALTWTRADPPSPIPVTRLAAATVTVRLSDQGLLLSLHAQGAALRIGSGGDTLLALLVGAASDVRADLRLDADHTGVSSRGTLGPIALPATADLGLVDLTGLDLTVVPTGAGLDLRLRSRLEAELGSVIAAAVDGLGMRVSVDLDALLAGDPFAEVEPDLDIRGIGLSLDAGIAQGGGFLARSRRDGVSQYGGVLQLRLGPVEAKAFGLFVDRRGTPAFVAVVSVEFVPALELGLGFTLNGVGGLLGHNVTVHTGALAAGLKDGLLGRVLFPPDPVAAAPAVLDTLAAVFPVEPGGFVVGPLLSLGWGRPVPLVRLDVAVALALPSPVLLVLGRARATFPTPEAAVIDLRASLLAQFGGGMVLVRAELEESRVGFASVQGGFGILARFGDRPTFVVTAGGFHPRFTHAPPELAGVSRISAELAPPIGLQLRISGYVALTPNTLQLGGSVEVAYSLAVVAVRGSLTLDALIQLDPFGFEVDLLAKVGVEAFGRSLLGVDLTLLLRGPTPWWAQGSGRVRLPWPLPDPSIDVGPLQWGATPAAPPPPAVSPLDVTVAELGLPAAWTRQDRTGQAHPTTLTEASDLPGGPLLTPWSLLRGAQRSVPIDMEVDRIGSRPANPSPCRVRVAGDVLLGGLPGARWSSVTEAFATGQYVDLADDAALTAPDFEDRAAGVLVDPATVAAAPSDRAVGATLRYEDCHPGERFPPPPRSPLWSFLLNEGITVQRTAAALSSLRASDRYAAAARPLEVRPSSAVRVADPATFATVAAVTSGAGEAGAEAEFGHWTDAAVVARAHSLSGLSLTKTGS